MTSSELPPRGAAPVHAVSHESRRRVILSIRQAPEAVGTSPAWQEALSALAAHAAGGPVLLSGEPGTGKRLAASLLHQLGDRAGRPFVAINAATVPAERLEDALYPRAARRVAGEDPQRTGTSDEPGLLELASGGTLLVEAIDEASLFVQAALVRLVAGGAAHRPGAARDITVDVRLVATTHRDLGAAVEAGRFSGELHQRLLQAAPITLPPLRDRDGDVALLADHFAATTSAEVGKPGVVLSAEALDRLRAHLWPGNVRELRNVIERAVLVCAGTVRPEDLGRSARAAPGAPFSIEEGPRPVRLEDVIRRHVLEVFTETRENVTRSALALGISRVALRRRLREYGVKPQV